MSINTIIKLLNFLITRLYKESQQLLERAYATEARAEDLRIEAVAVSAEATKLRNEAAQAGRLASKVVQLIKE